MLTARGFEPKTKPAVVDTHPTFRELGVLPAEQRLVWTALADAVNNGGPAVGEQWLDVEVATLGSLDWSTSRTLGARRGSWSSYVELTLELRTFAPARGSESPPNVVLRSDRGLNCPGATVVVAVDGQMWSTVAVATADGEQQAAGERVSLPVSLSERAAAASWSVRVFSRWDRATMRAEVTVFPLRQA